MKLQKYLSNSLSILILLGIAAPVFAGKLYRYTDEDGVPTIGRTLPAEYAPKGYDVIDDKSMRLLKRVPPAKSEAEVVEIKEQLQQQRESEIAAKRQQRADQQLLNSYNSEVDLIRARDAKIRNLQRNVELAEAREEKLNRNLLRLQQKAADQQLSSQTISESLKHQITTTQEDIQLQQATIKQQQDEIKRVTEQSNIDLQRLKQLLQASE